MPAPVITGAVLGAGIRLVREALTPEGWRPDFDGVIGVPDDEGRLVVPVPAPPGVYKAYVISGKRISNPVYFEVVGIGCVPPYECGPGPIPVPMRLTLGLFELRLREPQTILVENARPRARLSLNRQRFNGTEWQTVEERELGVVDDAGRLLDVQPAGEPGLFRDIVVDRETGTSSDAGLYEVRPRP